MCLHIYKLPLIAQRFRSHPAFPCRWLTRGLHIVLVTIGTLVVNKITFTSVAFWAALFLSGLAQGPSYASSMHMHHFVVHRFALCGCALVDPPLLLCPVLRSRRDSSSSSEPRPHSLRGLSSSLLRFPTWTASVFPSLQSPMAQPRYAFLPFMALCRQSSRNICFSSVAIQVLAQAQPSSITHQGVSLRIFSIASARLTRRQGQHKPYGKSSAHWPPPHVALVLCLFLFLTRCSCSGEAGLASSPSTHLIFLSPCPISSDGLQQIYNPRVNT